MRRACREGGYSNGNEPGGKERMGVGEKWGAMETKPSITNTYAVCTDDVRGYVRKVWRRRLGR